VKQEGKQAQGKGIEKVRKVMTRPGVSDAGTLFPGVETKPFCKAFSAMFWLKQHLIQHRVIIAENGSRAA
jgi:hypothetical protein